MLDIVIKLLFIAAAFLIVIGLLITGLVLIIRRIVINSIAGAINTGIDIYHDIAKK